MDAARFDTLTRFLTERSSRRRVLPIIAAVLGLGFANSSFGRTRAAKLEPCKFEYYTTENRRVRGYGYADLPSPCAQCATSRDCETAAFPLCLRDYTSLTSGTRYDFTRACGAYPKGVCGGVNACAPEVAQAGISR
jgi:hypothetical protein